MLQAVQKVSGPVLWANLHLLFWLSLIPFASGWMGENHFAQVPVAVYGFILMMCGIAYFSLTKTLIAIHDKSSAFVTALGNDFKGKVSVVLYILAILLTFVHESFGYSIYVMVALIWLIPDRRFENALKRS